MLLSIIIEKSSVDIIMQCTSFGIKYSSSLFQKEKLIAEHTRLMTITPDVNHGHEFISPVNAITEICLIDIEFTGHKLV